MATTLVFPPTNRPGTNGYVSLYLSDLVTGATHAMSVDRIAGYHVWPRQTVPAIHPQGDLVAWATPTGRIEMRSLPVEGRPAFKPNIEQAQRGNLPEARSVAFSPDGRRLAIGYANCEVQVVERETRKVLTELRGAERQSAPVICVAFHPGGNRLAVGSGSYVGRGRSPLEIGIWDLEPPQLVQSHKYDNAALGELSFSGDGQWLGYMVNNPLNAAKAPNEREGIIKLHHLETGKEHSLRGTSFAFDPQGSTLALVTQNTIRVQAPAATEADHSLGPVELRIESLTVEPGGQSIRFIVSRHEPGRNDLFRRSDPFRSQQLAVRRWQVSEDQAGDPVWLELKND